MAVMKTTWPCVLVASNRAISMLSTSVQTRSALTVVEYVTMLMTVVIRLMNLAAVSAWIYINNSNFNFNRHLIQAWLFLQLFLTRCVKGISVEYSEFHSDVFQFLLQITQKHVQKKIGEAVSITVRILLMEGIFVLATQDSLSLQTTERSA